MIQVSRFPCEPHWSDVMWNFLTELALEWTDTSIVLVDRPLWPASLQSGTHPVDRWRSVTKIVDRWRWMHWPMWRDRRKDAADNNWCQDSSPISTVFYFCFRSPHQLKKIGRNWLDLWVKFRSTKFKINCFISVFCFCYGPWQHRNTTLLTSPILDAILKYILLITSHKQTR